MVCGLKGGEERNRSIRKRTVPFQGGADSARPAGSLPISLILRTGNRTQPTMKFASERHAHTKQMMRT